MNVQSRNHFILSALLLYTLPFLSWVLYTYYLAPQTISWWVTLLGFILLFFGSSLFINLLKSSKQVVLLPSPSPTPAPIPLPVEEKENPLKAIVEEQVSALEILKEQLKEKSEQINHFQDQLHLKEQESDEAKQKLRQTLDTVAEKEEAYHNSLENLKQEVHQKQLAIQTLENQIHDLRYEIKTLLHLTEVDYSTPTPLVDPSLDISEAKEDKIIKKVDSFESAIMLLHKCLEVAQNMHGGYRTSKQLQLALDPYAFDLRRLTDALRLETSALVILYSPKDEKILFANKECKSLLGWTSDKFTQEFPQIIDGHFDFWKKSVDQLLTKTEIQFDLNFNTKKGEKKILHSHLAMIQKGIFRNIVIGILYSS